MLRGQSRDGLALGPSNVERFANVSKNPDL